LSAKHIEIGVLNIWPTYVYVAQMAYSGSWFIRIPLKTKEVLPLIWERTYQIQAGITEAVVSG